MRKSINNKNADIVYKYENNGIPLIIVLALINSLFIYFIIGFNFSWIIKLIGFILMFLLNRRCINDWYKIVFSKSNIIYKRIYESKIIDYSDIVNVKFIRAKGGYWVEFYFMKEAKQDSFTIGLNGSYHAIRIKKVIHSKDIKISGDTKLL